MHIALHTSLIATSLLLAASTASALTLGAPSRVPLAGGYGDVHEIAKKHHGKHSKRGGCRLTHDGLVCGGGNHEGGHNKQHEKGHGNSNGHGNGNGHGGKRH